MISITIRYQNFYIFQSAEVEETLKRIQAHKGVVGVIVVNAEGKYIYYISHEGVYTGLKNWQGKWHIMIIRSIARFLKEMSILR